MTDTDRYFLFICKAISSPMVDPKFSYFLFKRKELIVCPNSDIVINSLTEDYLELPKLKTNQKREFLLKFANKQKKDNKEKILKLITNFNDASEFDISKEIKKIDWDIGFDFFVESGKFLLSMAKELYKDYSLNDNMKVVLLRKGEEV